MPSIKKKDVPAELITTFVLDSVTRSKVSKQLPKEKKLFTRACGSCHKRHHSCDGKRPCENCKNRNIECTDVLRKQSVKRNCNHSDFSPASTGTRQESNTVTAGNSVGSKLSGTPIQPTSLYRSQPTTTESRPIDIPANLRVGSLSGPISDLVPEENVANMMTAPQSVSTINIQSMASDIHDKHITYTDSLRTSSNQTDKRYVHDGLLGTDKNNQSIRSYNYFPKNDDKTFSAAGPKDPMLNDVFLDSSSEDDENKLNDSDSHYGSSFDQSRLSHRNSSSLLASNHILHPEQMRNMNSEKKQLKRKRKLERLEICKYLGPKGFEILIDLNIDLLHQHFPLVPIYQDNGDMFNQEEAFNNADDGNGMEQEGGAENKEGASANDNKDTESSAHIVDFRIINLEKKLLIPSAYDDQDTFKFGSHSYILELPPSPSGGSRIVANPEWKHSLQYKKPSEIYSKITQPFLHTHGFTSLLEYIKKRFSKADVIKICYDIAAIRPVFIASCINFQEEDMIFMEHCFQRTLLEYASFIEEVGNPTIIWRRTGQISYVNDEFLMLTGWTRQQLLGKMTFVIEILDDESSLIFFKNFKAVCYSDYTGFVNVPTMKVLTPKKGKHVICSSFFIVKRDTFGLPTFTVGNFLPK